MSNAKSQCVRLVGCLVILSSLVGIARARLARSEDGTAEEATRVNREAVGLIDAHRYDDALPLARRALAIRERTLPPNHPDLATSLSNLGELLNRMGQYAEAEALLHHSLEIRMT